MYTVGSYSPTHQILDSLTAWLGEKRKTEFSWTPASQAVSETKIFAQDYNFLR